MSAPQDRPRAVGTVQVDNERVIVTEWRFAPGAETGQHRHGYDYVVVPMTTGALRLQTPAGEATSQLVAGQAYYRPAGVEHNVINAHEGECVFVEIEIKPAAGAAGGGGCQ
ncbi:cupin domain-containing protein [Cupriavidus sp. IK-TO18]|uniref:cupin domain-containing protein n=1 Tax=Cupriavidus sp. IK-TO18 TaxID=2782182 RepID=UPI00189874C6|nr:cupin domain-containing protein [Cupriavidus sp. IK-TO18]